MKKNAYVDFDGTIVDVMPRYYGILESYLKKYGLINLEYEQYCYLKRQGIFDHIIVKEICSGFMINVENYLKYKRFKLENNDWLFKDIVIGSPLDAYQKLHMNGYTVKLLSIRNNETPLVNQVESLHLTNCFDEIVAVKPISSGNAKENYLRDIINHDDIIIGDSYVEMKCAEVFGIRGFFVKSGLWNSSFAGTKGLIFDTYNEVVNYLIL